MKKIFLFTPIFLIVILFSQILPAHEEIKPDFKLVVTGGLSGVRSGYEFFYNSQLFRLNHKHKDETKLHVTNTEALVYKLGNNDKLFVYSDSHLNNQDLENLKSKIKLDTQTTFSGETSGLVGSAAHVVELNRNGLPTFHSKENAVLRKDIAGIAKKLFWQRHRVGKKGAKKILVLSFEGEIGPQTFVNIKKWLEFPRLQGSLEIKI